MSDINPGFLSAQFAAGYPSGAAPTIGASGNQANANAIAVLGNAVGKLTYIVGFVATATGATGVLVVNITIASLQNNNIILPFVFPAGVTTLASPLVVLFGFPGIPASALNTQITVTLPAGGSGNTNAATAAWGYML